MNRETPMRQRFPPPAEIERIDVNSARIYGLVARSADIAVIFRRGPGRNTLMLLWNLKSDTIEAGQWIKARIYERRCDLTPDGKFLVYFAANFRPPYCSWTAISRPPYFTALALWEKRDCWGGGGLFDTSVRLRLNHRPEVYHAGVEEFRLQDGYKLPKRLIVSPLGEGSGWGEDDPIMTMRMIRDGWTMDAGMTKHAEHHQKERFGHTFDPPLTASKPLFPHNRGNNLALRLHLHAINERQGRWYVESADVARPNGAIARSIGRVDWVDTDGCGDVLYAREGCLYRLPLSRAKADVAGCAPIQIADLNPLKFQPVLPPASALKWR